MRLLRKVHLMVAAAGMIAAFGGGLTATPAFAGDTLCTGFLTGTHDNIIVPSGAECVITDATVKGSVKVLIGGWLDVAPGKTGTTIGGNVDGEPGHRRVFLRNDQGEGRMEVKGNVQLKGSTEVGGYGTDGRSVVHIGGNVQYEGNAGSTLAQFGVVGGDVKMEKNTGGVPIFFNTIGGNLQAEKNTGGVHIFFNTIDGNLQCKENTPPPAGGDNTVGGNKEGQCAGF